MATGPPIVRAEGLGREAFERDFERPGRPAVVRGALKDWGACGLWTPEYLAGLFAERSIRVASSPDAVFGYGIEAPTYEVEERPFSEAVALIGRLPPTERTYYLMQQPLPGRLPEIAADFRVPECVASKRVETTLWFAGEGAVTPLHFDSASTFIAQVFGRKALHLFHPSQDPFLYPFPPSSRYAHMSLADPERPDLGRFPEFAKAEAALLVLEPGDLLFLPPFHWHHVRSLDISISVSFWSPPWIEHFSTPAGRRTIRFLFERDRLIALRGRVQDGGSLLDMARLLGQREESELAVLVAEAAVEECLRALRRGVSPRARPADFRDPVRMAASLVGAGVCSVEESRRIGEWAVLVSRARDGASVSPAEAAAMIEAVQRFTEQPRLT